MEKQEYLDKVKAAQQKIAALETEIKELKNAWALQAGFKVGDLVDVTDNRGNTHRCFIGSIGVRNWDITFVDYEFKKQKKDGTPSLSSAGFSYYEKIEHVK